jgi:hypothetical protein
MTMQRRPLPAPADDKFDLRTQLSALDYAHDGVVIPFRLKAECIAAIDAGRTSDAMRLLTRYADAVRIVEGIRDAVELVNAYGEGARITLFDRV